jgi:F-type H+-transporting ATPase subunit b
MNYELIAQWSEIVGGVAFVIVAVWLFWKYALPAVRSAAIARNADLEAAEKRRDDLRAEVVRRTAARDAALQEAESIALRAQNDAQRAAEAIVDDARREGTRLLQNARGELERGRIAARDQLRIEFIEKALLRARELAADQVTDVVNTRLINRTVEDLSAGASD